MKKSTLKVTLPTPFPRGWHCLTKFFVKIQHCQCEAFCVEIARKNLRAVAVALICVLSAPASAKGADGDVNALIAAYDSKDQLRHTYASIHADLVARGIWTAQSMYVIRLKQPELYCQPRALTLTGEQVIEILRRAVQNYPEIGKLDTGLGVFRALEDTFPCPRR
jgi:hypothetical protein